MKNQGKAFEEDIKKSVPKGCWYYRFRDGTGNFSGSKNENVRFQATNICDCEIMANGNLYLFELKSYDGASIPISGIRPNQLKGLSEIDHKDIKAYFLFNFRKVEKVYAVAANKLKDFIENTERKSIPLQWCVENGIEIPGIKKKVRYRYDLTSLLEMQN